MFLLKPAIKTYLWGGDTLIREFGKEGTRAAESWEFSVHPDGECQILSGAYAGQTLAAYLRQKGIDFPILVKLIDAAQPLSVQVHPDDRYARAHENSPGKTELWVILRAEPGAFLYLGLKAPVSAQALREAVRLGQAESLLQKVPVRAGEAYYIPAGMLHAIGAGIVLAEVQQSSNVTYRVYDYGRRDANGQTRELHIEKALAVASLAPVSAVPPGMGHTRRAGDAPVFTIARTAYFTVERLPLDGTVRLPAQEKGYLCALCAAGEADADDGETALPLRKGTSLFIERADIVTLRGQAELLLIS